MNADETRTLDLPRHVLVDEHGHYWRDYGDYLSMCPVSDENTTTEVMAVYVLIPEIEAEIEAIMKKPGAYTIANWQTRVRDILEAHRER